DRPEPARKAGNPGTGVDSRCLPRLAGPLRLARRAGVGRRSRPGRRRGRRPGRRRGWLLVAPSPRRRRPTGGGPMTTRTPHGRALFYTRDSGGKHEMTPGQYVAWARQQAHQLGLSFGGTPEALQEMIRTGRHRQGDLFLDYGVSGNVLSRDGLNALLQEALTDRSVSHVLIPRRDR